MNVQEGYMDNNGDDTYNYKVDMLNRGLEDQNINISEKKSTSKRKNILRANQRYKESPSRNPPLNINSPNIFEARCSEAVCKPQGVLVESNVNSIKDVLVPAKNSEKKSNKQPNELVSPNRNITQLISGNECSHNFRPKDKSKRTKQLSLANHGNNRKELKKIGTDMIAIPHSTKPGSDESSDSFKSKDMKRIKDKTMLEDTYDMPLDVAECTHDSSELQFYSKHSNIINIESLKNDFHYEGNEKEFIQQQQFWLLNGQVLPNEFVKGQNSREKGSEEDVAASEGMMDHAPQEPLQHEHRNHIYMEVESATQNH